MKICAQEPRATETLFSISELELGDVFCKPGHDQYNEPEGVYMVIWAPVGKWGYTSLSTGQTWTGSITARDRRTVYTLKDKRKLDTELYVYGAIK